MRHRHHLLLWFCLIVSEYPGQGLFAADHTFAEQAFVLAQAEAAQLTREALDGSGDSALRLSRFYSNVTVNLDDALK